MVIGSMRDSTRYIHEKNIDQAGAIDDSACVCMIR